MALASADAMTELTIRPEELLPARTASRELGQAIDRLEAGEVEKYVIVNRNQLRAVLVTVEHYARLVSQ